MGELISTLTMEFKETDNSEQFDMEYLDALIEEDEPEGSVHKLWVLFSPGGLKKYLSYLDKEMESVKEFVHLVNTKTELYVKPKGDE